MKIIIIKIGTNLLTDHHQRLDLNNMRQLVYQIADINAHSSDYQFIIVSSGAITCGAKHINISTNLLPQKQAAASIGQILLFQQYYEFFQTKNMAVGQLLLTKDNFEDPKKRANIIQTIHTLLSNNVIPIINENDSVSTEEIEFGDNDQLSAILASHIHAHRLILLTSTDGVLDKHQTVIPIMHGIGDAELSLANDSQSSPYSKGGMRSKLLASQWAITHDVPVTIANGRTENIIPNILDQTTVTGTNIYPLR